MGSPPYLSFSSDASIDCNDRKTVCRHDVRQIENYAHVYQDEIQSAHWESTSTTIYTTMLYYRETPESANVNDVQTLRNISKDDSSSNSSFQFLSHDVSFNSTTTADEISEAENVESETYTDKIKPINDDISSETSANAKGEIKDSGNYKSSQHEHTVYSQAMEEKEKIDQNAISVHIETTESSTELSTDKIESTLESKQQTSTFSGDANEDTKKTTVQNEQSEDKNKISENPKSSQFETSSAFPEVPTEAVADETTVTTDIYEQTKEDLEMKSTRKRSLNSTISSKSDEINPTTAFRASTEIPEFQTSISTSISEHSKQSVSSKLEVSASMKKVSQKLQVEDSDSEGHEVTIFSRTASTDLESTTNSVLSNKQNGNDGNSGTFGSVENDNLEKPLVALLDEHINQNSDMMSNIKLQPISMHENIELSSTEKIIANEKDEINSESFLSTHSEGYQSSHPALDTFTEYPSLGSTFDPDGVTNQDPPDPDSVTFSIENSEMKERELDRPVDALNTSTEIEGQQNGLTKYEWNLVKRLEEDMYGDEPISNESSKVVKIDESFLDKAQIFSHQLLPHDDPDVTVGMSKENVGVDDSSKFHSPEELTTVASSINFEKSESSGILHNGASNFDFEGMLLQNRVTRPSKYTSTQESANKNLEVSVSNDIAEIHHPANLKTHNSTVPYSVEAFSLSFEPQTAQSEVRPVMLKIPSPPTSVVSASSQGSEPSTAQSHRGSSQTMSFEVETTTPGISSPIILPNPAPSNADEKLDISTDLPTTVIQPELAESLTQKNFSVGNVVSSSNSTISGIAVKTSVSVSIPVMDNSSHNAVLKAADSLHDKADHASMSETISGLEKSNMNVQGMWKRHHICLVYGIKQVNLTDQSPSSTSTPAPTTESGVRIRKPKIKIPGIGDAQSRERRPFTPRPPPKPSTSEGPPVSIFNKARTRRPSITSSTTAASFHKLATVRIHYATGDSGLIPLHPDVVFSMGKEPSTTTVPTTTETEEPFSDEPFTDQTQTPSVSVEDDVTLIKVAGYIVLEKGIRWNEQLDNRHSPAYKERANFVHLQLERLFRSSAIAPRLWKIRIDGFSGLKDSRAVAVDFFVYLIKTKEDIKPEHLTEMFHDKLKNNTFSRFRVDTSKTAFELLQEEHLNKPIPSPEESPEPPIPQWAIAVIVIGAASLIFIILFAAVTVYGRHHMRRRYSSKLSEEDIDRSGDWESKMASAYENLAADTIYDAEDLQRGDSYKKHRQVATFNGRPLRPKRCDSWSSSDWSTAPRRQRPHVHRIVY
ncbi:mucin-2-like [Uloborus diversus]|uniref:mucin-2-like n=1 Tax=Uloborus diversus TaxID=327109 RepID=UPI00240986E4|nr:mucin-2-like [Uloborus diversus]